MRREDDTAGLTGPTVSLPAPPSDSSPVIPQSWGRFQILDMAGRGGFGEVYRAFDPQLEREVALKLLREDRVTTASEYESLLREARLMARVRHSNIVTVYGIEKHDGRVGFWSDFIHGKTISSLLASQGTFSPHEAAIIGAEVCKALSAVHGAGLLHGDINASNVMREERGRIVLMDFGLSRRVNDRGKLGGTPPYMAPEVIESGSTSVASDIYSTGVLLFHMVTGKFPVNSTTLGELRAAHQSGRRIHLLDERPELPAAFVRVVEISIDSEPARRFASAGEMLSALAEITGATLSQNVPAAKRPPRWLALAIASAVLLLPSAAWLYDRQHNRSPSLYRQYEQAQNLLIRYDKAGNLEKAIAAFEKVAHQDPAFSLASAGLARAYYYQYRLRREPPLLQKAQSACDRAMESGANLAPVHVSQALVQNIAGHSELAMRDVETALQLDSRSPEAYAAEAEVFKSQGRAKDVIVALQRAIDLAPDDWRWPNQLATYYYETGKIAEAAATWEKATRLVPDNAITKSNLAVMYLKLERLPEAQEMFEKSIAIQPTFGALSGLGALYAVLGKFPESADMNRRAIELNSSNYVTWGNLASAYLWSPGGRDKALGAYREAITLAERSRSANPKDARLLANLGAYYAALGEAEQSFTCLRQALALEPDNTDIMLRTGEAYEILGKRDEALHWIGKALNSGFSLQYVQRSPELAGLRSDPRFRSILEKLPKAK